MSYSDKLPQRRKMAGKCPQAGMMAALGWAVPGQSDAVFQTTQATAL
jgi:hypothetical protein